ncbi:copper amine oxidase N-terminal domain-containing protein [Paenibacillus sp. MBLB2552]|uniref:Copper amine oxidase N-terminal domain-containing protein n=1 Tax=Paenibacillus mellifer TaxID=2937794 RepID=A0A9X2BMN8_9BACL|nr:copper amine oxidase N-terminal domain-containing protein [Paenibacillus mellifer]MCK8485914.1 copper amine oxidase N-terminal domain-containing protein [Paenibacillus mellifer]
MRKIKWLAIPLALLLVALTGCQAVGGFDVAKALASSVKTTSSESKQTVTVEVVPAASAKLTAEDQEAIDLINSFSLNIDSAKVQDTKHISMKGSVGLKEEKIPFLFSMDDKGIALEVEGAKQPLYISLQPAIPGLADTSYMEAGAQELSVKMAEFVLKHFPNPSVLTVKQTSTQVNGETLNLTNLHAEVRGDELFGLIKPFLSSAVKDEQGLKDLIGGYYDVLTPFLNTLGDLPEDTEITPELAQETKKQAIDELYTEIKQAIEELLATYDEDVADLFAETPELATVFGKDTVLKLDLYFDSKLNIRKQTMELNVTLPASEDLPISAIKVRSDSEMWNIGGTVTADQVDTREGVLDVTETEPTPGQILRNFKDVTPLYKLLKEDFQLGYKQVVLDTQSEYYGVITKNGTSFVPLRYLSEQLDAEVKWTPGSGQLVVIDDLTGKQIVLKVGSKQATVDGKVVQLSQPAFVHKDGSTYVPLRFLTEALGATVDFDAEGWITIIRE